MNRKLLLIAISLMLISSLFLAACSDKDTGTTPDPAPADNTPVANNDDKKDDEPVAEADAPEGWIMATDPSKNPEKALARGSDTLILGITNPAGIFNPWFYETSYDKYIIDSVFDSLLEYDYDGSLKEDLATYEISDDGLVYTFKLKEGVTFTDGTPLTAHDAEFSYYIFADPSYAGRIDLSPANIKGWDEFKNGDATTIEGVKVVDDHTLQVEVTEPGAKTLALIAVTVLPKHYYSEGYSKGNLESILAKNAKPLGSGQFIFEEFIAGQEVRLTANENYFKGAPNFKNLIFKSTTEETYLQLLQIGDIDFQESVSVDADNVEFLKGLEFVHLSMLPNNGYGYIAVNQNLDKFKDVRVRQALAYGLNREDVVYAYSQGYSHVIDVPQSNLSWAYPDEDKLTHYEYNPEKAAQLLDEAGWKLESDGFRYKDGEKFTINFSASTPNPVNEALIPYAVENYKDLGIDFVAEQLEFNSVVEKRTSGNFEMLFLAVGLTPDPDPRNLFHSQGSQNYDGYSNPKVDELIEAGLKELDQDKRQEIYHELYQIFNEELPVITLYQRLNMNVPNARLENFNYSPYKYFSEELYQITAN